ncbi:VIT domain-containing protein [Jidongwangia harbinensis]|uniref:VIT domain-containing protein n=1 Tax=Jidongwangia harbinensis TaxID=2878561 RepID=UPI001CD9B45A|nr:VIT domain-containing protein [Jidongwangia harbinensis]MCA2213993.1 VWA domain-containing protein [Jidongwangia harbinensis]
MTLSVTPMGPGELGRIRILPDGGFGALHTDRGNLPLDRLDVRAHITGLVARTVVTAEFVNVHDTALEATYIFPLPDRAAVVGMTMTADGRTVSADLRERGAARETYDRAIEAGQRASIAEEERPDVFTIRVGNLVAGERVAVELRLVGPLPYEDDAATYRFPLVVAPRYVPGTPLPGPAVGEGRAPDTDLTPDASRITPPVLLPGFPNPLRLSVEVDVDPAGLTLDGVRSSLHTVTTEGGHLAIAPGEKADRDFILRLAYAAASETAIAVPDPDAPETGTYQLTVVPPAGAAAARPKDVVLLLDRSGSMGGWKMVAARRAAARIVDTLTAADRFAVRTFDHQVERPDDLDGGLVEASDRNRFRAVEHLSRATARGGTDLLAPLHDGLTLLADSTRDRVLVLVTDGQVGNEDHILRDVTPLAGTTRVHTIGIDRAVNAGFLARLAALGAGRTELVESEDRLDEAMERIHRRIGAPVVTDLTVSADGFTPADDERSPARLPGLYPGVPLVVSGRYTGAPAGTLTVTGRTRDDQPFRTTVAVRQRAEPAVTAQWARARLRDLEDRYAAGDTGLEKTIVDTSLRFGVLCRFTAYVAVDTRVVHEGGTPRRVTQPVELPSGWQPPADAAPAFRLAASAAPMPPPAAAAPAGMPPTRPSFAPVRAQAGSGVGAAKTFAAVPSSASLMRGGGGGGTAGAAPSPADVRALAGVEARRLAEAEDRPAYERRDLLDDLLARLAVLVGGLADAAYEPLRALVAYLGGDDDLAARWSRAREVLTAFADGTGPATGDRRAFWKR